MSDTWDDYAEGWDDNESVKQYAKLAFDCLLNQVSINGKNILDFGCGTGQLTAKMALHAQSVVGMDTSEKMLKVLSDKAIINITTYKALLDETFVNKQEFANRFELITSSSVLAFVDDPIQTLTILKSCLKDKGFIVQWDWLNTGEDEFGFTAEQLKSFYFSAGFDSVEVSLPFALESKDGKAQVIMAVAQNT